MSGIESIVVLGAGTMGHGIAQVAAVAGYRATLVDIEPARVEAGLDRIRDSLDRLVAKEKLTAVDVERTLDRLWGETDRDGAVAGADLVVEAIPEDLAMKCETFRALNEVAPADTIFATNTSSLPVTEIAAASGRPDHVIGMHFFNPVPLMKLIEIVRAEQSSPETVAAARAVAERMGKEIVEVTDSPGFATSRLGVALALEAIRMLEEGVASAADIDAAMKLGYRHPMGPLELTDLVGLDVRLGIADHLRRELGDRFRAPALMRRMVRAGKLGRKSGEGFYRY